MQQKRENYEWQVNVEVFRPNRDNQVRIPIRAWGSLLSRLMINIIYNDQLNRRKMFLF